MTRVLELLVSLVIVAVLAVLVGAVLPSHGHIERTVEVSNPLRQVFDSVNTFRRFPEWACALRRPAASRCPVARASGPPHRGGRAPPAIVVIRAAST